MTYAHICSKSLSFSGRERWEFGPSLEGKSEVRSLEGRGEVGCGVKKEIWVRTEPIMTYAHISHESLSFSHSHLSGNMSNDNVGSRLVRARA
jgi:hypothetical protein